MFLGYDRVVVAEDRGDPSRKNYDLHSRLRAFNTLRDGNARISLCSHETLHFDREISLKAFLLTRRSAPQA